MNNIYDDLYRQDDYYRGFTPSPSCYRVLQLMPPVKHLKLLDIGCGEGRNALFFARNGYEVTAFDIAEAGVDKTKNLAEKIGVNMNVFRADILQYRLTDGFDILFSAGVFHYIPEELRKEIIQNYKEHTSPGGLNAFTILVKKPFIAPAPEKVTNSHKWLSGELFTFYHDWKIEYCTEEIFDCLSGDIPHQHAVNRVLARKM